MSKPLSITLIIIFVIHFLIFLALFIRRKQRFHLFLAITFIFLILYHVIRVWWTDNVLFGYPVYSCFRVAAWVTTGLAGLIYVSSKLGSNPK